MPWMTVTDDDDFDGHLLYDLDPRVTLQVADELRRHVQCVECSRIIRSGYRILRRLPGGAERVLGPYCGEDCMLDEATRTPGISQARR